MPSKPINVNKIIESIRRHNGMVSIAAQELNLSRATIYNQMAKHPQIKEALTECRETLKDNLESALMKKVKEGDTAAIIFGLKTLAKDRGYVERNEFTGVDGSELIIKVIREDGNT